MVDGTLEIDLKDTTIIVDKPNTFLKKLAKFFMGGPKEVEVEVATQLQYLEKIQKVLNDVGFVNVVSLSVNGKNVYYDEEHKENDLADAFKLALAEKEEEVYHCEIVVEPTPNDDEQSITVNMYNRHNVDEMPLVVEVSLAKTAKEVNKLLENVKAKINDVFGIDSGEIWVGEDDEDEDSDDEEGVDEETEEDEEEPVKKKK